MYKVQGARRAGYYSENMNEGDRLEATGENGRTIRNVFKRKCMRTGTDSFRSEQQVLENTAVTLLIPYTKRTFLTSSNLQCFKEVVIKYVISLKSISVSG
jgi:hypothetical protein